MMFGAVGSFIAGVILGSFLNVLIVRLKNASSLWGRSQCVNCKHAIRPHHLVPIVSWIALGGRCADCRKPIHIQYPLVELFSGCLVLIAFFHHDLFSGGAGSGFAGLSSQIPPFLFESFFGLNLLFLAVFDWRWKLLPLEWMIVLIFVFGVAGIALGQLSVVSCLIGLMIGFGFLGLQYLLSGGRWIGGGDPWMAGMIGAVVGWPLIVVSLFSTYIVGAIVSIFLLATGRATKKTRIAFGPLLAVGGFIAFWFGNWILLVIHT